MWFEIKRNGYYPLLIELMDNKRLVVHDPSEIPNGVAFKVIKTNYAGKL